MITLQITEQTPHNMLRAIRAACNELLGDMPADLTTQAAQHNSRANELHAAASAETDKAAACLTAHNAACAEAFNQTSGPSIEDLQASGQLTNVRVEPQDEAHLDLKPETDSTGAEWNPELHASTKTKNSDGTWKKRRGAGKTEDPVAVGERIHESFANAVDVQAVEVPAAAPSLPPLPPAPPSTLVTMNDIYAQVTSGKVLLNDVIAGAQAMGFADVGAFSRDATPEQRAQLLAQLTKGA